MTSNAQLLQFRKAQTNHIQLLLSAVRRECDADVIIIPNVHSRSEIATNRSKLHILSGARGEGQTSNWVDENPGVRSARGHCEALWRYAQTERAPKCQ